MKRKERQYDKEIQELDSKDDFASIDLPDLILDEILTNLPLKTVFRFKSVSKRWNSFISAPFFSKSYIAKRKLLNPSISTAWTLLHCYSADEHAEVHDQSKLNHVLSKFPDLKNLTFTTLDVRYRELRKGQGYRDKYNVVASSNGLLLCYFVAGSFYAICDPITRRCSRLPLHKTSYKSVSEAFVTKVEESTSKVSSYKVIRLQCNNFIVNTYKVEVYDSETLKWTKFKINVSHPVSICGRRKPICLNGIIHWEGDSRPHHLVAYDPSKNQCSVINFPIATMVHLSQYILYEVCNGKLHYIHMHLDDVFFQLWVLEDYDRGKWVLKNTVTIDQLNIRPSSSSESLGFCLPLAFHPFDSTIIYMCYCSGSTKRVIIYDAKQGRPLFVHHASNSLIFSQNEVLRFILPWWPLDGWDGSTNQQALASTD